MGGVQPFCNIKASTLSEINKKPSKALVRGWPKGSVNQHVAHEQAENEQRVFDSYLKPNERFGQFNT